MIRAECRTADDRSIEFDATPWFEEADDQTIGLLAGHDWRSPWVADGLESHPGYGKLRDLLQYARALGERESEEDPTWSAYECSVNAADALAWLAENRPELASRIKGGTAR
jgi:hypothetical protein